MSIITQATDRAVGLILRKGTIRAVDDSLAGFRQLTVELPGADFQPGCKVQFRVQGTTFRTFTPFGWDGDVVSFLAYHHDADGPAVAWIEALTAGDEVQVFGPRKSLSLSDLPKAPVFVGDETSLAVAAAWARHGSAAAAWHVFEATHRARLIDAFETLELGPAEVIERTADDGHHAELSARVVAALHEHPSAPLVLTGKAQTIAAVRAAVKAAGLNPMARVKAYWDPRRSGLD